MACAWQAAAVTAGHLQAGVFRRRNGVLAGQRGWIVNATDE
jgi:hypothetical protein